MKSIVGKLNRDEIGIDFLRFVVCAILFTHGTYRYMEGSLPKLGEILSSHGLPFGYGLAILVNLAETGGTILLAARVMVRPITLVLSLIYLGGIILFHRHAGFFVVGPGSGGWDYSALIISCLLLIAWNDWTHSILRSTANSEAAI